MVIFIFYFENILYSIQTLHVNFWFVCLIYINDFILSRKTIWSIGYNAFPPVIEEMHGSHKRCDPTSWWGVLTVMHNRWCLYTCVGRMVRCWWGVLITIRHHQILNRFKIIWWCEFCWWWKAWPPRLWYVQMWCLGMYLLWLVMLSDVQKKPSSPCITMHHLSVETGY